MFTTSDSFILRSAGLDALVLQKSFAFGVQLFLPIAVLSCVIRELLCFGSAGCCSLCACGAARNEETHTQRTATKTTKSVVYQSYNRAALEHNALRC